MSMYGKHIDYFRIECGSNVSKQVIKVGSCIEHEWNNVHLVKNYNDIHANNLNNKIDMLFTTKTKTIDNQTNEYIRFSPTI